MGTISESDIQKVFEKISSKSQQVNLSGLNNQDRELRQFTHLKEVILPLLVPDENGKIPEIDIIDNLEKMFLSMYATLNQSGPEAEISPMKIEDGKVIISDGTCCHTTLGTMERLESLSNNGVLATEWYGVLEGEGEGRFCAFLSESHDGKTIKPNNEQCVFYYDMNNPIMQELLKSDFFEYVYLKRTNPDIIRETFSEETLELFEKVIEPLSAGSKLIRKNPEKEDWYWKAIPGGVPPQLVNGLCISSNNIDIMQNLEELAQLFPNATIFNENREVLHEPEHNNSKVFEELKMQMQGATISGANLGQVKNVDFDLLTEHFKDEKMQGPLKNLQDFYISILQKKSNVTPMDIGEDGKVIIHDGMLTHWLSTVVPTDDFESERLVTDSEYLKILNDISKNGITASEWFGVLESAREGVFCAFLDEEKAGSRKSRDHFEKLEFSWNGELTSGVGCTLYIDEKNPIMQDLIKMDFFQYLKNKRDNPQANENIPEWVQELFDDVIEPNSVDGNSHPVLSWRDECKTWRAIPGGIPPQCINGICINSAITLGEHIEEIRQIFPNATIFNEDREVLYSPQLDKNAVHLEEQRIHTADEIGNAVVGQILPKDLSDAIKTIVDDKSPEKDTTSIGDKEDI